METAWKLMNEEEEDIIWNRVVKEFAFEPSTVKTTQTFTFNCPYDVYDISKMSEEQLSMMDEKIRRAFVNCIESDEYMYALDWQPQILDIIQDYRSRQWRNS